MRRTSYLLLASSLTVVALAATSNAVPVLVDLKIQDSWVSVSPPGGDEALSVTPPGSGKGKSGDKSSTKTSDKSNGNSGDHGKPTDDLSKGQLKSLTLWISKDGQSWRKLDGQVVDFESDRITAKVDAKGSVATTDQISLFGLPTIDVSGQSSTSYFIGVSSSSTSFESGGYMTQLVSWQYYTPNSRSVAVSVPEPAVWPLLGAGLVGLGAMIRSRRKS